MVCAKTMLVSSKKPSFGLLGPSKECDYDKSHEVCPDKCSIDCNKCNCNFEVCDWDDFDTEQTNTNSSVGWKNETE